jgi:hypothetical protein
MNQTILADVKKASAGSTVPIVRQALHQVGLKCIQMGEGEKPSAETADSFVNAALFDTQRT